MTRFDYGRLLLYEIASVLGFMHGPIFISLITAYSHADLSFSVVVTLGI